jgi:hypothetical protein
VDSEEVGVTPLDITQPSWPQEQVIAFLSPIPSQWALQNFSFPCGMQLQAALAHFFGLPMVSSSAGLPLSSRRPDIAVFDAELRKRDGER